MLLAEAAGAVLGNTLALLQLLVWHLVDQTDDSVMFGKDENGWPELAVAAAQASYFFSCTHAEKCHTLLGVSLSAVNFKVPSTSWAMTGRSRSPLCPKSGSAFACTPHNSAPH